MLSGFCKLIHTSCQTFIVLLCDEYSQQPLAELVFLFPTWEEEEFAMPFTLLKQSPARETERNNT